MKRQSLILAVLIMFFLFTSCTQQNPNLNNSELSETGQQTTETSLSVSVIPSPTPKPKMKASDLRIWEDPDLPREFIGSVSIPDGMKKEYKQDKADILLKVMAGDQPSSIQSEWVYVLVVPFPTIMDGLTLKELKKFWMDGIKTSFGSQPILMTEETRSIFEEIWGKPRMGSVKIMDEDMILKEAWDKMPSWAIIPFGQLEPRWKVLSIDGLSPLDKGMDIQKYPLTVNFGIQANADVFEAIDEGDFALTLPSGNFNPDHLTNVMLTGTTAMVRYLALRMEEEGVLYPSEKIGELLRSADITHISNEVSFYDQCPPANPVRREMRFCSAPEYFDLLEDIGTDVIELTGNHILDWGYDPFLYTIKQYDKNGMKYYGGGINLDDAKKPLLMENNGNKIGFIGCSPSGPENVWATKDLPGSAKCDWKYIQGQIDQMLEDGYLPIFTFQHIEADLVKPHSSQRIDFQAVSDMGAVIVSGSQAHFPQAMTFKNGKFIHYGLGNTFFDQMDEYHRSGFMDEQVIYEGRHISTRLYTIILEDHAQPRLMTDEERESFLTAIFEASEWEKIP